MLRELNTNEMEMVSGGDINGGGPSYPGIEVWDKEANYTGTTVEGNNVIFSYQQYTVGGSSTASSGGGGTLTPDTTTQCAQAKSDLRAMTLVLAIHSLDPPNKAGGDYLPDYFDTLHLFYEARTDAQERVDLYC